MNLFELFVKIGVDDQASDKLSGLSSKLGNGLKTAANIGAAAVGAAAAGITALTTAAVNNYAEYEQLVGGVETLFKTSSDKVLEYAENAYKTAGLSANEYMETVTSFSASLLQSLGGDTEAAVKYADMAITDMSDNANKMGTDMSLIQNAYQGFAKQNYTMLDNLKLGYGGTQAEMERLIADAAELSDTVDAQSMSFENIVEAIHVVQTEMGITGTTALEAGQTISGSIASMKSAWENLLTGLADGNADIEQLVDNLVTTIVGDGTETNLGVLGNILPAVETALNGASTLVSKAFPKIMDIIPTIINDNLPILAKAAVSIVQSLVDGISQNQETLFETVFGVITYLVESFITMLPQIVQLGLDLILSLATGLSEALPELIPTIVSIVLQIYQTLVDNAPMLLQAALSLIIGLSEGLINAIPVLIQSLPPIITGIVNYIVGAIPQIMQAGITLLSALVDGLPVIIAAIVDAIPQIIDGIVAAVIEGMPLIIQAGTALLIALIDALPIIINTIITAVPQIITAVTTALAEHIPEITEAGEQLFVALVQNLPEILLAILEAVGEIGAGILGALNNMCQDMVDAGYNLIAGIWQGIRNAESWLLGKISGFCSGLVSSIKGFLGIASPSKVFAEIGGYMVEGLGVGWNREFGNVKRQILSDMDFGTATMDYAISTTSSGAGAKYGDATYGNAEAIVIPITLEMDGEVLARLQYTHNRDEASRRGTSLVLA